MEASHVTYVYPDGYLQAVIPFWSVGTDDVVAGWTVDGSRIMYWATAEGCDPRSVPLADRFSTRLTSAPRTWQGTMFRLFAPEQPWQLLHFFNERGEFMHWYVDFETPKVPDGHGGWTTTDLELDLIIHPDFTVALKDQDDFAAAENQGFLDGRVADEVRALADGIRRAPQTFSHRARHDVRDRMPGRSRGTTSASWWI